MSELLSNVVQKALQIASAAHFGQRRKGDNEPFIIHPVTMAMMLQKEGMEDNVIATALVHDVLEDTDYTEERLRKELGEEVHAMVRALTNQKGLSWKGKKLKYIESVRESSNQVKMVALADKIHNMQCVIAAYCKDGNEIWKRFNATKAEKFWFEEEMLKVFQESVKHPWVQEYEKLIKCLNIEPAVERFGPKDSQPKKKILYVEDDFFLADIYKIKFAEQEYGGVYVADGITAWEVAHQESFDLILTGIMMPWRDGLELLKQLKDDPKTKNIPVIIISNLGEEFVVKGAMNLGAADYFLMSDVTPKWVIGKIDNFFSNVEHKPRVKVSAGYETRMGKTGPFAFNTKNHKNPTDYIGLSTVASTLGLTMLELRVQIKKNGIQIESSNGKERMLLTAFLDLADRERKRMGR